MDSISKNFKNQNLNKLQFMNEGKMGICMLDESSCNMEIKNIFNTLS